MAGYLRSVTDGVCLLYAARTPAIMELVFANRITFFELIIVQRGLVFSFQAWCIA